MHELLAKTGETLNDIVPFGVLLFLFVFVFAILGMQVVVRRAGASRTTEPPLNGPTTQHAGARAALQKKGIHSFSKQGVARCKRRAGVARRDDRASERSIH